MKRKWTAILLCAVLAVQPAAVVGAEELLSSEPEVELSDGGEASEMAPVASENMQYFPTIGECGAEGDNVTYKFDEASGALIISGTGAMKNCTITPNGDFSPFYGIHAIRTVVIEEGVTEIGNYTFSYCSNLTSVKIPESVKRIGDYAFDSCHNLKFLIIPETVEEIGEQIIPVNGTTIHGSTDSAADKYAETNGINFKPHSWDEGTVESDATCTQPGLRKYKCTEEGCSGKKEEVIPPTDHAWEVSDEKLPTCTTEGYRKWKCKKAGCQEAYTEFLKPEGHVWESAYTTDKAATCVTEGKRSIHCSECGMSKPGSQITIPARGHDWDEGVITKYPTCTQPGIRTCTCERCKWTLRKEVAPTGHTYEGKITKATFEKDGIVSGVCKDCGHKVDKEVIPQVTKAELSSTEYTYNGENRQPKVVLKDRTGKELKPEDYSVTYPEESKRPGTYKLTITLTGDSYEGTLTKEYTVKKGNQVIGLEDATKCIDSKTVTLRAEILQGNKTGKFSYKSSAPEVATVTSWGKVTFHKVGKVEITATTKGSANYNSAQKTITLTIAPAPTAITKLQSQTQGWLNIQYRANPDADGYQIQYGTSPDMYDAKYASVNDAAIRSYTRKDVESGETYYVRVRTYNVVDGERIYSNWSSIKSADVY